MAWLRLSLAEAETENPHVSGGIWLHLTRYIKSQNYIYVFVKIDQSSWFELVWARF